MVPENNTPEDRVMDKEQRERILSIHKMWTVFLRAQNIAPTLHSKEKRSFRKLKVTVKQMKDDQIDVYLLQKTWDKKGWMKKRKDGYTIFHHNNDIKQSKTGVAIVLSPRYSKTG